MSDDIQVEIEGLRETQEGLTRILQRVGAGPGMAAIMARATLRAHRYTSAIVHVDTGRLKNSLFPTVQKTRNTVYGIVGTNVVYAPYEHARGGSHAFFERTIDEEGVNIARQVERDIAREVNRA